MTHDCTRTRKNCEEQTPGETGKPGWRIKMEDAEASSPILRGWSGGIGTWRGLLSLKLVRSQDRCLLDCLKGARSWCSSCRKAAAVGEAGEEETGKNLMPCSEPMERQLK